MDDMNDIINRINKIKQELSELQNELEELYVYGKDSNNLVEAVVTGKGKISEYKITGDRVDKKLTEALVEATNDGLKKASKLEREKKQNIIGDIEIPDIPGLF